MSSCSTNYWVWVLKWSTATVKLSVMPFNSATFCFLYFQVLFLGMNTFILVLSSWCIDSDTIMLFLSLAFIQFLVLKCYKFFSSGINKATRVLLLLSLTGCVFFYPFCFQPICDFEFNVCLLQTQYKQILLLYAVWLPLFFNLGV